MLHQVKRKLKKTSDVLGELLKGRHQITDIEADIDSKNPERMNRAAENLKTFFLHLVDEPKEFNDRLFRFCINRFKRLYVSGLGLDSNERVIKEVVKRFGSMPEATDIFVDYLSLFRDDEFIQRSVLDFLESQEYIYPWQEMLLLELLVRVNSFSSIQVRANQYANYVINSNRHPACKARAYLILGKNGSYAERRDIRAHYENEEKEVVKRSIIVAMQEMRSDERNNFYKGIEDDSRSIGQIIKYVQALPRPTYDYYHPPQSYDVIPQDYDSDDLFDLGSEYFL